MNILSSKFIAKYYLLVLFFQFFVGNTIFPFDLNELSKAPIVGLTQDNQTTILIRGSSPGNVQIEYFEESVDTQIIKTDWKKLSYLKDLTLNFILKEIKYSTNYNYRIAFDDGAKSNWYNFSTFPEQSLSGNFNFIFSACFRDKYTPHNIFQKVLQVEPTFVMLLGDQMYADYDGDVNDSPLYSILPAFRSKYLRNFGEHFQALSSHIPIVATWDDHDYGHDNSDGTYPNKEIAKKVFKENYPAYPFESENGGLYYKFIIADVDVFVLDTRWYRTVMADEDYEGKTMLGEDQILWLLDGLKQSEAPFKLIVSSVSFNDYGGDTSSDKDGYDSWRGYKVERDEILSFIERNQIKGVMVFSGDQHYPSGHILNWKSPLNSISETDSSIVYSLTDLGTAIFDFSASPFHYTRASGGHLSPQDQNNPLYSHEIFRAEWGHPGYNNKELTSVYGLTEVDTKDSIKSLTVSFYEKELNSEELKMLYKITVTTDQVTDLEDEQINNPTSILVAHNYPNPFNGETNIVYSLNEKSEVELSIYDLQGSKIITLIKKIQNTGDYKINWNGKSSFGEPLPSGIYFYRLTTIGNNSKSNYQSVVKKMVYLK